MEDLTIIIPAKNESESLGKVIKEIESFKLKYLVVVSKDDLSTIDTIGNKQIYYINQIEVLVMLL